MIEFFKSFKSSSQPSRELADFVFKMLLVIFAAALILEAFLPGFVTNWFNPAWILLLALISSIISQDN